MPMHSTIEGLGHAEPDAAVSVGPVFFLVYISAAVTWFSPTALRDLLATARTNNEKAGITGMLLYKDGNFMQALEGEETAVRALYRHIATDRRHCGVVVIDSGHSETRQFGAWRMGFSDLQVVEGGDLPEGYSTFLNRQAEDAGPDWTPQRCWQMLKVFRQLD